MQDRQDFTLTPMDPTPAISAAATNIAAAVTASAIASLSPRNTIDNRIPVARVVGVPVSSIEACRDPVLRKFEDYLHSRLREEHIITDELDGIWLFNVNQAAYIIEESNSKDEKRMTRQRVASGLQFVPFSTRAAPGCSSGEFLKIETDRRTCMADGQTPPS
jgi:hypothetical protein